MNKVIPIVLILSFSNVLLCQSDSLKSEDILGCWKSYPEEKRYDFSTSVFRPCDYTSPKEKMMRGRFKMNLMPNGKCSYLKIGPTDINLMTPCEWNFDTTSQVIKILSPEKKIIRRYLLKSVNKTKLEVKPLNKLD